MNVNKKTALSTKGRAVARGTTHIPEKSDT